MGDPVDHPAFRQLDGRHPFREAVPGGYVDYPARRLRGSELRFFNFALAREMGLIPADHPDRLDASLRRAVLDAFSLVIVNEWDESHGVVVPARERLPGRYMATRYLQLQHPGRTGRTSGDGRSIWNGCVSARGTTWDVTSCGTGVTRLCPATAREGRFFRTGARNASYGCGTAAVDEGLAAVLMSETFHANGIATERMLAVIELENGYAINVRAGRNLLRPSHFFAPLKQGRRDALRGIALHYAARQIENGAWPALRRPADRMRCLAEQVARAFGRAAATFESEYVFCWLDWDGDNVLADGGIIDYGSVRQFGLYHREYRFDDAERWSTTIPEQRRKARAIAQAFVQIREFLRSGDRPTLRSCARDPVLALFDREFAAEKERRLLWHVGFSDAAARWLARRARPALARFARSHAFFERERSQRGPVRVPDGLTWNAVFSARDLLRELPLRYLAVPAPLGVRALIELAASSYASRRDREPTRARARHAHELQDAYLELVARSAAVQHCSPREELAEIARRSEIINRRDRITGDSIDYAAAALTRARRELGCDGVYRLVREFASHQALDPAAAGRAERSPADPPDDARRVFDRMLDAVDQLRHGL
jgi:hypothetical protein